MADPTTLDRDQLLELCRTLKQDLEQQQQAFQELTAEFKHLDGQATQCQKVTGMAIHLATECNNGIPEESGLKGVSCWVDERRYSTGPWFDWAFRGLKWAEKMGWRDEEEEDEEDPAPAAEDPTPTTPNDDNSMASSDSGEDQQEVTPREAKGKGVLTKPVEDGSRTRPYTL